LERKNENTLRRRDCLFSLRLRWLFKTSLFAQAQLFKIQIKIQMKKFFILAALLLSPAHAAPPSDLIKCSAIKGGIERLACFDSLANAEQKTADQSATTTLGGTKESKNWIVSIGQSKLDDSQEVWLKTDATEPVRGRFGKTAIPQMILRCSENTTAAYIFFDGHFMSDISGNGKVTFRIDKDAPFYQNLSVSGNNKALGHWSGNASIPFIKKLVGGNTLIVQATPHSESPVLVTFDISGLESQLEPLRKACKW
jgi:type VI secretion system protein VasI